MKETRGGGKKTCQRRFARLDGNWFVVFGCELAFFFFWRHEYGLSVLFFVGTHHFACGCAFLACVAVCCSVLQCVAVCCSVLQCVAVCCRVLQCVAGVSCLVLRCSLIACVAVCCSVLQCVAGCCRVLQLVAVGCSLLQFVVDVCCCVLWLWGGCSQQDR